MLFNCLLLHLRGGKKQNYSISSRCYYLLIRSQRHKHRSDFDFNNSAAFLSTNSTIERKFDIKALPPNIIKLEFKYPQIPNTSSKSTSAAVDSGLVYLIGTAHQSSQCQADVRTLIRQLRPDVVMLEQAQDDDDDDADKTTGSTTESGSSDDVRSGSSANKNDSGGMFYQLVSWLYSKTYSTFQKSFGLEFGNEFKAAIEEAAANPITKIYLIDQSSALTFRRLSEFSAKESWQLVFEMLLMRFVQRYLSIFRSDLKRKHNSTPKKSPDDVIDMDAIRQRPFEKGLLGLRDASVEDIQKVGDEFHRYMARNRPYRYVAVVLERDWFMAKEIRRRISDEISNRGEGTTIETGARPVVGVAVVGMVHLKGIQWFWKHWSQAETLADVHKLFDITNPESARKLYLEPD